MGQKIKRLAIEGNTTDGTQWKSFWKTIKNEWEIRKIIARYEQFTCKIKESTQNSK